MNGVCCFTSATCAYLDRVRVLGETVRRHHPSWTFCVLLADEFPRGVTLDLSAEPIDRIVHLAALDIPRRESWMFEHELVELCTAVKGPMLRYLLDAGASKVVYLDPDIALLGPLDDVEAGLDRSDIMLTPHLLEPETTPARVLDNELSALKHGVYNLGFLAVANSAEGRRFARWWSDRLLTLCFDDPARGLFTDQRWCDHAPVFFPTLHILRDPGYNVASWNVAQRPLTIEQDGAILAGGRPLRFFHFTKFEGVGGPILERLGRDQRVLWELIAWYRDRLAASRLEGLPPGWWAYGRYDDGQPIRPSHRLAYRESPELQQRYPFPFASGVESLQAMFARDAACAT